VSLGNYRHHTVWQTVRPWPEQPPKEPKPERIEPRPEHIDEPQMALIDKATMGLGPRSLAVLKHIANNPSATVGEIAQTLKITSQQASNSVCALAASGRIRREVERLDRSVRALGNRIHHYFLNHDHPKNEGLYQ